MMPDGSEWSGIIVDGTNLWPIAQGLPKANLLGMPYI